MAKTIYYQVKYKPHGLLRWRHIKNVREDGIIEGTTIRFFINDKDERIELDLQHIHLIFSPERVDAIEELNKKIKESALSRTPIV